MAAFKRATYSTFNGPVLLGRIRSGVLPTNAGSIEELGGLSTSELAAADRAKTSRSSHAAHVVQETLDVRGVAWFRLHPVRPLPRRNAVHVVRDHEDGSVQGWLQRPAEVDMNPTEWHRRASDFSPHRRSLPPLSFQAPNARQHGARQSNTLLLCSFHNQKFIHVANRSVEQIDTVFRGVFFIAKAAGLRARTAAA